MARKYEGSAADMAEDAKGAKAMGVSPKAYEKTARDKKEDARGGKHKKHKAPKKAAMPMPGPHEFSAPQEAAMRSGMRSQRGAAPTNGSMPQGMPAQQSSPDMEPDANDPNEMGELE